MIYNNAVRDKSKAFALQIIRLYRHLCGKHEFVLSKQILRSGTSIGANIREAQRGQSKPDFYSKLNIALKEADETKYWIDIIHQLGGLTDVECSSITRDVNEVIYLLTSIIKTTKANGL